MPSIHAEILLLGFSRFWLKFLSQNLELILGSFILAFILAYFLYRRTYPPLGKGKKIFLACLRFLALFFLFLAFSNIIFFFSRELVEEPLVVLLVDNSKSMNLKSGETTRKKIIEDIFSSDFLEKLKTKSEILTYSFSDTIKQFDPEDGSLDFSGEITSIGTSLKQVQKNFRGRNLKGVLLLSDGTNNFGENPVETSKSLAFPLFTSGIGEHTPIKDVSIEKIDYPDLAYLGKKNQIKVSLSNQGFEGLKLPLILKQRDKILDQKNVVLAGSGQTQELDLELVANQEGIFRYDIIIPPQKKEALLENNKRSFSLKVLKSKINILCLSGRLSWEYTFLERFLSSQENIEFQTIVYGKNGRPLAGKFPPSEDKLNQFDLIVFLDTPGHLLKSHNQIISEFLKEKPALFLVGEDMIQWRDFSPFLDILPFNLKPISVSHQSFNLKLTPAGRFHPITELSQDPFENPSLWSSLPPFLGIVGLGQPDPEARILAEYSDHEGPPLPGIVVKVQGKTKIMVVLVYPLWRWDFWLWGVEKDNQAYKNLWENSIRWLTTPEDLERFNVKTNKPIYKSGEPIEFKAKLYDESYQKIIDAFVEVKIKSEKSEDSILISLKLDESGDYSGIIGSLPPGEYSLHGVAKRDEKTIGEKTAQFLVEEFSLEILDLNPDKELLKKMAQLTNGKYYEPQELSLFLEDIELEKRTTERTKKIEIWSSPLLLILFILFVSVELYIRRRSQLL
jgi:hypothetical protein